METMDMNGRLLTRQAAGKKGAKLLRFICGYVFRVCPVIRSQVRGKGQIGQGLMVPRKAAACAAS
jgi:hypothetical protein